MPARTSSNSRSTKAPATKARSKPRRRKSTLASVLELISLTFWGRVLLVLLIAALVAAINMLISGNQYELFFRLTGIEMVLVAVFFWIRFLIRKN